MDWLFNEIFDDFSTNDDNQNHFYCPSCSNKVKIKLNRQPFCVLADCLECGYRLKKNETIRFFQDLVKRIEEADLLDDAPILTKNERENIIYNEFERQMEYLLNSNLNSYQFFESEYLVLESKTYPIRINKLSLLSNARVTNFKELAVKIGNDYYVTAKDEFDLIKIIDDYLSSLIV